MGHKEPVTKIKLFELKSLLVSISSLESVLIFWCTKEQVQIRKIALKAKFPKLLVGSHDFNYVYVGFKYGIIQIYDTNILVKVFESKHENNEILVTENQQTLVCNNKGSMFIGIDNLDQNRIRVCRFDSARSLRASTYQSTSRTWENRDSAVYGPSNPEQSALNKKSIISDGEIDIQSMRMGKVKLLHIAYVNRFNGVVAVNREGHIIVKSIDSDEMLFENNHSNLLNVSWIMMARDDEGLFLADEMGNLFIYKFIYESKNSQNSKMPTDLRFADVVYAGFEITRGTVSGNGKSLLVAGRFSDKFAEYSLEDFGLSPAQNDVFRDLRFEEDKRGREDAKEKRLRDIKEKFFVENHFVSRSDLIRFLNRNEEANRKIEEIPTLENKIAKLEDKEAILKKNCENLEIESAKVKKANRRMQTEIDSLKMRLKFKDKAIADLQIKSAQKVLWKMKSKFLRQRLCDSDEEEFSDAGIDLKQLIESTQNYQKMFEIMTPGLLKNIAVKADSADELLRKVAIDRERIKTLFETKLNEEGVESEAKKQGNSSILAKQSVKSGTVSVYNYERRAKKQKKNTKRPKKHVKRRFSPDDISSDD